MKHLSIILCALLLVGCDMPKRIKSAEGTPMQEVIEFPYKGHYYIYFVGLSAAGVVHDPDCRKCMQAYD